MITTLLSYYHKTIKLATVLTQKRNFVNFCRFQAPTPVFVDTSQIKLYNYIIDDIKIFFPWRINYRQQRYLHCAYTSHNSHLSDTRIARVKNAG